MIKYLNSFLDLDNNTYILRYLDTDLNQIEEKVLNTKEELEKAKSNLDRLDLKLIYNLLKDKSEEEMEMENKLMIRFKSILNMGFKFVIMPYHELYLNTGSLIDFIFNHYHSDGVEVSFANDSSLEYMMVSNIFENFGEFSLRSAMRILKSVGKRLAEPDVEVEHFYKLFMIVFNKPNSFEHSIDITLLFNNLLGMKHDFESRNEKVPDRLLSLCELI